MRLISYMASDGSERAGLLATTVAGADGMASADAAPLDLSLSAAALGLALPATMGDLLSRWPEATAAAARILSAHRAGRRLVEAKVARLLAPVPHPGSCRDGYAFRQHVEAARRNRGAEMIPEFDQFPVFYFTNHRGVVGEGAVAVERDHLEQLDFELEAAIVIGRRGKNIAAAEAEAHIAGLMVMNDFSARQLQSEEMKLSLGPAKGKDFATALGPWLVTLDELEPRRLPSPRGSRWDLSMTARHNGELISRGNLKEMSWTFAELIERASYGAELFPGDIIGSGTVGTGCYLELNGTRARAAKERGEPHRPTWLNAGDEIALSIEGLGTLTNHIERAPIDRRLARAAAVG